MEPSWKDVFLFTLYYWSAIMCGVAVVTLAFGAVYAIGKAAINWLANLG